MDEFILLLINGHYSGYWDVFMTDVSWKFTWVPLYIVMVYMVFRSMSWKKALLLLVCVALAITMADQIGAHVIRPLACRLRPSNPDNPLSAQIHIVGGYRGSQYGMPSCHAANSMALLTFMCLAFRSRKLTAALTVWLLSFCYSRMYLGVHYPTDILVGLLVGAFAGVSAYWIFKKSYFIIFYEQYKTVELKHVKYSAYAMLLTYLLIAIQSFQFS